MLKFNVMNNIKCGGFLFICCGYIIVMNMYFNLSVYCFGDCIEIKRVG